MRVEEQAWDERVVFVADEEWSKLQCECLVCGDLSGQPVCRRCRAKVSDGALTEDDGEDGPEGRMPWP